MDEKRLTILIGMFVTATQIGTKLDARQGIFLGGNAKFSKFRANPV